MDLETALVRAIADGVDLFLRKQRSAAHVVRMLQTDHGGGGHQVAARADDGLDVAPAQGSIRG